jgi:glycosyltransferase involved in cell wall biosynthesis
MTLPLLSAVIPTRNRPQLVCEAIESALSQRHGQVEVIVVDDGSTDNTAEVIGERFGSRVKYLRHEERKGAGASRNTGIRASRGHLVAFLDDDDLWLPGKLDAEISAFEQFPDAKAVVSDSLTFLNGEPAAQSFFARNGLLAATQGRPRLISECRWLWTNSMKGVAMCSITVQREILDRMGEGWFPEDLITCEDWEFEMRVYHRYPVIALPQIYSSVRLLDDGARIGRASPGKPRTREQQIGLLSDRLKVMERSHWLNGLSNDLAGELERYRNETRSELAQLATEV